MSPGWGRWPPTLFPHRLSEFLCPAWLYFPTAKGKVRVRILFSSDRLRPIMTLSGHPLQYGSNEPHMTIYIDI